MLSVYQGNVEDQHLQAMAAKEAVEVPEVDDEGKPLTKKARAALLKEAEKVRLSEVNACQRASSRCVQPFRAVLRRGHTRVEGCHDLSVERSRMAHLQAKAMTVLTLCGLGLLLGRPLGGEFPALLL
jgi:hypothetical protein